MNSDLGSGIADRHDLTRREVLGALALGLPAGASLAGGGASAVRGRAVIAAVVTEYRKASHGQGIVDRFLEGYGWQGRHHPPPVDVVALYVDQKAPGDLSQERASRHPGLTIYPTIAEALTRGTGMLAVDGVLRIGEHGNYPRNARGQTLYPRYEFFQQIVEVFRRSGRCAPVFNDKHLSWRWDWAKEMVETARQMGFPLMAGSSLPVTWRLPPIELPPGCEIEQALMVGGGGSDPMDFHALEAMQSMVERRRGGETGVRSVQLIEGDAVWKAGDAGQWSWELLESALSRSDSIQGLTVRDGRTQNLVKSGAVKGLVPHPAAYLIDYVDGTHATLLMLDGALADYNFAARVRGISEPFSCQFLLPPIPNVAYSACLMHQVETMFESGRAPYPVERTLLVSGVLESCLDSKLQAHRRLNTPHLAVRYQPPRDSGFCRC